MGQYNFKEDLKNSEASVLEVVEYLKSTGVGDKDIHLHHGKEYDIMYNVHELVATIEVKEDLMHTKTGNVAVEFWCNLKPSGITSTLADVWVYRLADGLYWSNVDELKRNLKSRPFRRVQGGDGRRSSMLLVPVDTFKSFFTKIK